MNNTDKQSEIRHQIDAIDQQAELRQQELKRLASRKEQLLHLLHVSLLAQGESR